MFVSHENVTGVLAGYGLGRAVPRATADRLNGATALDYDVVVAPSRYAAGEFRRLGRKVEVVPLGVDAEIFAPGGSPILPVLPGRLRLVHCGRLDREKDPRLAIECVRELVERRVLVELLVLGDGPLRSRLEDASRDLPVRFLGHVTEATDVAGLLASADVALASAPTETFGLAAAEAMACGTPVVCVPQGALQEVVRSGGLVAEASGGAFADAVLAVAGDRSLRAKARHEAMTLSWEASAVAMSRAHAHAVEAVRRRGVPPVGRLLGREMSRAREITTGAVRAPAL